MHLFFATLAFGTHGAALILAALGVVAFTYRWRHRKDLGVAALAAYGAHLGFLALS